MGHRCSIHCIMPPYVLKNLLEIGSPDQREKALKALLSSTALRADRRFMSRLGFIAPVSGAGKQRMIFDCENEPTTRNAKLIRRETDRSNGDIAADEAFDGVGTTFDFITRSSIATRSTTPACGSTVTCTMPTAIRMPCGMDAG